MSDVGDLPPQTVTLDDEARVEDLGKSVRFTRPRDNKTILLRKTASNPNAALGKRQWKEPLTGGVAGETETKVSLVLFVREGWLYLAERVETNTVMVLDLGGEKQETRSHLTSSALGIPRPRQVARALPGAVISSRPLP